MLTLAFGECTISRTEDQLWYNRFMDGREDANTPARLDRPITSTTNENIITVKKMILDNCRITTIGIVAENVGISLGSCSNFYGCHRYEICGSEDNFKIGKF